MQAISNTENSRTRKIRKRYTPIEDAIILECVKDSPDNLSRAFENASKRLRNREVQGISLRWYKRLKHSNSNVFNTRSFRKVTDNKKNDVRYSVNTEGLVIPVTFKMAEDIVSQLSAEERTKLFSKYIG